MSTYRSDAFWCDNSRGGGGDIVASGFITDGDCASEEVLFDEGELVLNERSKSENENPIAPAVWQQELTVTVFPFNWVVRFSPNEWKGNAT